MEQCHKALDNPRHQAALLNVQLDFGAVLEEEDLREEVRQFLKKRLAQLRLRPGHILLRDKVAFVLGTLDLWLSAYWLGWR